MGRDRNWFGGKQQGSERNRQTRERAQVLREEAEEALQRQDYAATCGLYRECLEIYRKLNARKEEAGILRAMAAVHAAEGDYKLARGVYEEGIALCRAIGDNEGLTVALYELGQAAAGRQNYNYARKLLLESKELCEAREDRYGQTLALYSLSSIAFGESDPDAARSFYRRGLEAQRGLRESLDLARALMRLSRAAAQTDDFEAARMLYAESIQQYRNAGYLTAVVPVLARLAETVLSGNDRALFVEVARAVSHLYTASKQRQGEPEALCALGHAVLKTFDTSTAYALFKEALALSAHPDDGRGRALAYLGMGSVAWKEEHDTLAHSLFDKCLALSMEQTNSKEFLPWLSFMCKVLLYYQNFTDAAVYYARCRTLAAGRGDIKIYVDALCDSAYLARVRGDLEQARQWCEECLLHYQESDSHVMVGRLLYLKGNLVYDQGDVKSGRTLQQQGLMLSRKEKDTPGIIAALLALGFCVLPGSDLSYERACLEECLLLSRTENDRVVISYIFHNQGELARMAGDLPAAYRLFCKSLMLKVRQRDRYGAAYSLESCAIVATNWERYTEAAHLFGNAAALRTRVSAPLEQLRQAEREASVDRVRAALGNEAYAAARSAGEALTLQEAFEVALKVLEGAPSERADAEAALEIADTSSPNGHEAC